MIVDAIPNQDNNTLAEKGNIDFRKRDGRTAPQLVAGSKKSIFSFWNTAKK
jgi:hypothetical protein